MKERQPRIIVFSGKGGTGKTTVAAATAVSGAARGLKTIVISIDLAHSLSDSFDLGVDLHDHNRGRPKQVADNLWIQEVDIQEELENYWGEVSAYLAALFGSTGMTEVLAEELAIIPGMEDVVSLLYINQYYKEKAYDLIVVDCAPTGESLRFISMPSTLEWYMNKLFRLERNLMRVARPVAKRVTDIPVPDDSYFASLKQLFDRLDGVEEVLSNREVTTVRLVTNAEKMVIRETQRAFMYFCLYGLLVDAVIVNRLFPQDLKDGFFQDWIETHRKSMEQIHQTFDPIPVKTVELLRDEVTGIDRLAEMGRMIYDDGDPSAVLHDEYPYEIKETDGTYTLKIKLPFVAKEYVNLFKEEGELVVRIGSFKRHVFLPRALFNREVGKARLEEDILCVDFPKAS